MSVTIQNIAGGCRHTSRTLNTLAKFVATNPVFGGYVIASGKTAEAQAVVSFAESARRDVGKNDWDAVIERCCEWADASYQDEAMEQ